VLQSALFSALLRFKADMARLSSELDAFRDTKKSDTARPAAVAPPPDASAKPRPAAVSAVAESPARGFPSFVEEFRVKRFNLLWRGSRDGFIAQEFHFRCDWRANTLTLISDTDRNVFGAFTPVKWESGDQLKGDSSLRSFLFTLRYPHILPRPPICHQLQFNLDRTASHSDGGCGLS
jgi:hypothetical protein